MKNKYIFLSVILIIILAIVLYFAGCRNKRDYMLASGHPQYPPFMWQEGDRIAGVGPEILSKACKQLGIPLKIEFAGSWDDVLKDVRKGKIDTVVALYQTDERKKYLEYSVPYAKDPVALFVRKDKTFPYQKWNDLIGKRGTTTAGDSYGQAFDSFIAAKLNVTRLKTVEDNFKALENGKADYFIYALYSGLFESKKMGLDNKITYLKPYVTTESWYLAIRKGSKYAKQMPDINRIISGMVRSGLVDKLTTRYTAYFEDRVLNRVKRMVDAGLAYYIKNGQESAFAEIDDLVNGRFSKGDLYLFAFDLNGKCLAHGADHSLIGRNLIDLKDVDGKQFIREFIAVAKGPGQGWVSYKWKYKNSNEIGPKISYIERIKGKDILIGCGFYTEK